ncbi:hypothetical protein J8F10_20990 [Gemmata sp. G18]|uniref:MerR family transcriptional regulator n=1 Tax=Gemmata palustris TaxID=2822762 RepID=A0ABS5BVP9_9BACT|nr:hypothetical protein [Gemmata palustris]MBP3957735.1 hypothetical protein [Gemmata palustris]
MDVSTPTAARILRISRLHAHRMLLGLGCVPRTLSDGRRRWGVRHLLAVLTTSALIGRGVRGTEAEAVGRAIASIASDEMCEAAIADGRSWVMLVGHQAMPELLFRANVEKSAKAHAEQLSAAGLQITAIDIAPLYVDLRAAVTAATEGVRDASE